MLQHLNVRCLAVAISYPEIRTEFLREQFTACTRPWLLQNIDGDYPLASLPIDSQCATRRLQRSQLVALWSLGSILGIVVRRAVWAKGLLALSGLRLQCRHNLNPFCFALQQRLTIS